MGKLCVLKSLLLALNLLSLSVDSSYFELVTKSIAFPATFNTTTAVSVSACCLECDKRSSSMDCIVIGYNTQMGVCLLSETSTLTHGPVQTIQPTGFQVFNRGFSFIWLMFQCVIIYNLHQQLVIILYQFNAPIMFFLYFKCNIKINMNYFVDLFA